MQLLLLVVGQLYQGRVMMSKCRNCGHDSHCGVPFQKEFRGQSGTGGIEGMIEVCKNCRCEQCEPKTDWG